MCGIAGFYNTTVDDQSIRSVIARLQHRGPDAQQFYLKDHVGLIHTRLSILDLSPLGAQPYRFEHLALVFNGELYNYREIREELKKQGYQFQSNSDTEVLIKAFHCWGERCVERFIGMFAFCVYDELAGDLYLFRDRVGVKPLYYHFDNGKLFFASELKALSVFNFPREIDPDAVSLYFRFGFVPQPLSIYKSVSKLAPGAFLKVSGRHMTVKRYWDAGGEAIHGRKESEWMDELENLLISAFRYRMVSDVPVGVFLSGGIDSSLLTAILQKHHGGIHTFTIGFNESRFDETPYARKVAAHLSTQHTQKMLSMPEARHLLSDFYTIYDEPFADTSGIPTSCVSLLSKQNGVKVVLSADGGDELFGGYTHYLKALQLYNKFRGVPVGARKILSKSIGVVFPSALRRKVGYLNLEHKAYALEEIIEADNPVTFFQSFLANQSVQEVSNMLRLADRKGFTDFASNAYGPLETMMDWDFKYYLPDDLLVKVDRATMFHGIECREPFLDHRLVEFARRMPMELKIREGNGKYILKKLLNRYVPREYFDRPKQGFSIPIFKWFTAELDEMFDRYLSRESLMQVPFFDAGEIMREHKKYLGYKKSGQEYNIEKMWRVLSFMMWWETYQKR